MILLTGASGFIGTAILRKIEPEKVICNSRSGKSSCCKNINCNLQDISTDLVPETITTIIHSAAILNNRSKDLFNTNVQGTSKLIEFAKQKKVEHFIFISSSCVQLEKKNRYALSKLEAEKEVIASGLNYTIIRPDLIYGNGHKQFVSIVSMINKFKIIPVPGKGDFDVAPVYIDDLVTAILSCVENKKTYGKIYSICGENMKYNEFLEKIAEYQNLKRIFVPISERVIAAITYFYDKEFSYSFQNRHGTYTQAYEDLNFRPLPLEEGLNKYFMDTAKI